MEAVIPVLRVRGLGAGDRKEQAHGTWENVKKKKKDFKLSYFSYEFRVVKHHVTKMNMRLRCTNVTYNFKP